MQMQDDIELQPPDRWAFFLVEEHLGEVRGHIETPECSRSHLSSVYFQYSRDRIKNKALRSPRQKPVLQTQMLWLVSLLKM